MAEKQEQTITKPTTQGDKNGELKEDEENLQVKILPIQPSSIICCPYLHHHRPRLTAGRSERLIALTQIADRARVGAMLSDAPSSG
jgi:hypothetical protein